jgi:hypothetical protein
MATTEALLQELIGLQKEEMKRTRHYRITRIVLGMLPTLIFLGLTIWGSFVLYQGVEEAMKNLPDIMEQQGFQNFTPQF